MTKWVNLAVLALLGVLALSRTLGAAGHAGIVTFNGLPVPGATVTATRGDLRTTTATAADGSYRLPDLADGAWTIQVTMLGFVPASREVVVGEAAPLETFALDLRPFEELSREGALQQSVPQVAAASPVSGRSNGGAPSAPAPANRPAGRGTPAPQLAPLPAPANEEGAGATNFGAADGLLINGSVNNAAASPFAQMAAFGNNRRGGRSLYNGGLGIVLGNSAWDARPFTFSGQPTAKPSYDDMQVLGTFSGPIRFGGRNGPVINLGFQRNVDHNATTLSALMPTERERAGDFSASVDALGRPVQVIDPLTGRPFSGNVIPKERISPQASSLLSLYPDTNTTAPGYNYQTPVLTTGYQHNVQLRATQTLRNRHAISGNWLYSRSTIESGGLFGFLDETQTSSTDAAVNWMRRWSPMTSTRVRYQFLRQAFETTPYFADRANISGEAGITGNNQEPENWGPPNLTFSSGIAGISSPQRSETTNDSHMASGEILRSVGRHNMAIGAGLGRQFLNVNGQQNARGSWGFSGSVTSVDFADFILGVPSTSAIAFGNFDKRLRATAGNAYFNDDWRLSPSLTINAGLRWEYESPMTEIGGRLANLDVTTSFSAISAVTPQDPLGSLTGKRYESSLLVPDRGGLQPRLGVAWRPVAGSSLVIRGGYGIYRNMGVYHALAMLMAQQPPFSKALSVSNSPSTPLTLANGFPDATGSTSNTIGIAPEIRVGFAENWQGSVQRDLPGSLTVTGTYFGTRGHHLLQQFLPNTYPAGALNPCPSCPVGFTYVTSDAESERHAGQLQLRRRLRNGLSWTTQYTLASATDNASAFVPTASTQGATSASSIAGATIAQDWLDLDGEEGRSSFDQRHQLTAQFQYTTGMGVTGGALVDGLRGRLFKGWTLQAQLSVGSGLPVTPLYLTTIAGSGVTGTVRGSLTDEPTEPVAEGSYANPAGFAAPASGAWGTAAKNSITGPAQFSLNGGVGRSFLVGDRYTIDWRLDATNLLNQVTYSGINSVVGSPQFGLPNRANTMRKIQTSMRLRF